MASWIERFLRRSSVLGRPSEILKTSDTFSPASCRNPRRAAGGNDFESRVPRIAGRSAATCSLSASLTLMNTRPLIGNGELAAIWDFA